ncbi:MAG: exodeoxyribonuclease VII large subunit [Christiangramia sp.]|uniref:exodeoxyribonuclease VII large subunit n=1 Tax=Christiangramia sp. TaxID=1931228 RepID=UPI0032424127
MPDEVNGKKVFTLLEVTSSIQKTLSRRYGSSFWIKAEMNKLNLYKRSGHCYPELVEKRNGKIIAEIKANLWKDDYLKIDSNFRRILKEPLKDGIKILFSAKISFHPRYGLSLIILDIDPSFTLGDLEREKKETIKKLQIEGIFNKNKKIALPLLLKRIAVISVETSKGYSDFLQVLEKASKNWGYQFFHFLFPSLLQGDGAVKTMIGQLRRIRRVVHHFDVVAIIRGGGGDIGLSCYNNYELSREVALFPIPVISGIGHSTNETVVELISSENSITPTKLAEFLIQKCHNFSVPVQKAEEKIIDKSKRILSDEKIRFASEIKLLRSTSRNILIENNGVLNSSSNRLLEHSSFYIRSEGQILNNTLKELEKATTIKFANEEQYLRQLKSEMHKDSSVKLEREKLQLEGLEKELKNLDPVNVLKRGYSITKRDGKALRSADELNEEDIIETTLLKGKFYSKIINNQNHTKNG